ncbi:hypothetical protein L218DRAFT_850943 [Marasmius fiardii PR-910]|nr:hypothetical protein L218DRAFT_850943 [Marasmius fiardii PR-910]
MPPLGIHANAVHGLNTRKSFGELGGRRNDENWDIVKRRKLGKVKEERKAQDEYEDEDESEAPAGEDKEVEVTSEPALVPTVGVEPAPRSPTHLPEGLLSPTTTSTLLPGSFPTDILPASVSEKSVPRSAIVEATVPVEAQVQIETKESQGVSTSLTVPNTQRRPVRRSALDIALAMQLRPGLGVGADPAWMVRFLMAMFGWFVVLISGSTGDAYGYGMAGAGVRGL